MKNDIAFIRASCVILVKEDKILAAQRNANTSLALLWELPGGKIESGESPEVCIHREIKEELDISIKILQEMPEITHYYPNKNIQLFPFIAVSDEYPKLLEHNAFDWITLDQISSKKWAEADLELLNTYREIIQQFL